MNSVVIVAAGSGRRMNLDINKQYIKLDEKEMIAHTIDVFYSNENIDEIIVCIREEEEYFFEHEILDKYDFRIIYKWKKSKSCSLFKRSIRWSFTNLWNRC